MRCLYCRKLIGPVRRLQDAEFCCSDHRNRLRSKSARIARTLDDDSYEPFWPVIRSDAQPRVVPASSYGSTLFFSLLVIAAVVVAAGRVPGRGGSGATAPVWSAPAGGTSVWADLKGWLRDQGAIDFREEFSSSLRDWSSDGRADGWQQIGGGMVRPGRLRLWKQTHDLRDYRLEFAGQIENKAMSWAYRAKNSSNYYATKLVISKPGPLPRAELVRYAMVGGQAGEKTRLPLPVIIQPDTVYKIQLSVRGNTFSTAVNGQVVDAWSDDRLKQGGVGFFADPGERATIAWAAVTNQDTALGRMLSYFGFWLPAPVPAAF